MGSGYKAFTAGSVLTASDVNNYLMEQSVMYFANTTARDSAITSPEDGMVAYIGSNDANEGLYLYQGSAWRKGPGWNAPWGVVGTYSSTTTRTTTSLTPVEVDTGYRLTVATAANRRLKFTWSANYANVSGGGLLELYNVTTSSIVNRLFQQNTTIGDGVMNSSVYVGTSSASSTTYTIRYNAVIGGTFQVSGGSGLASQFTIEDIGPSGAPS
jgi:hypothetical protein